MEWTQIIVALLSGTTFASIFEAIRYWKQNKKLKENEVKVSSADAQKQDIDLSDYFKDKMLSMMEQFSEKQQSGNDNQQRILDKLDKVEDKVDGIETYLNGPYHEWLAKKEKGVQDEVDA